jgi:hypothetical protein
MPKVQGLKIQNQAPMLRAQSKIENYRSLQICNFSPIFPQPAAPITVATGIFTAIIFTAILSRVPCRVAIHLNYVRFKACFNRH